MAWVFQKLFENYYLTDKIEDKNRFRIIYLERFRSTNPIQPTEEYPYPFCSVSPCFTMPFDLYDVRLSMDELMRKITSAYLDGNIKYVGSKKVGSPSFTDISKMIDYSVQRFPAIPKEAVANTPTRDEYATLNCGNFLFPNHPIKDINWEAVYFSSFCYFRDFMLKGIKSLFEINKLNPEQAKTLVQKLK